MCFVEDDTEFQSLSESGSVWRSREKEPLFERGLGGGMTRLHQDWIRRREAPKCFGLGDKWIVALLLRREVRRWGSLR